MCKYFLFSILLVLFILSGCSSDAIWTGQTYSGTITKNADNYSPFTYWDSYPLYCSGTWKFDLTSKDNVDIYLEGDDSLTLQVKINDLHAKSGSNSVTTYVSGFTNIDICVRASDADWQSNGYKAGYSFTATLMK